MDKKESNNSDPQEGEVSGFSQLWAITYNDLRISMEKISDNISLISGFGGGFSFMVYKIGPAADQQEMMRYGENPDWQSLYDYSILKESTYSNFLTDDYGDELIMMLFDEVQIGSTLSLVEALIAVDVIAHKLIKFKDQGENAVMAYMTKPEEGAEETVDAIETMIRQYRHTEDFAQTGILVSSIPNPCDS